MRYYYDDALIAAYMLKYHGMAFEWEGCAYEGDSLHSFFVEFDSGALYSNTLGTKYYVREDSLHLLESRNGDVVTVKQQGYPERIEKWQWGNLGIVQQIIQRNGVAFHWPKSATSTESPEGG